ncbi:hypothetical protein ACWEOE_18455 [Amycolatopsis sp. NPDC004368]
MNTLRFTAGHPAVEITRVAPRLWHALHDDRVTGRAEATTRADGRVFLSVDAWHRSVFDQLAPSSTRRSTPRRRKTASTWPSPVWSR